jgi:signal transduction histidine kinase
MTAGQPTVPLLRWVGPVQWLWIDMLAGAGYGALAFVALANRASSAGGWLAAMAGAVCLAVGVAARRRAPTASLVVLLAILEVMAVFAPSTTALALPPIVLALYTVAAETPLPTAVAALLATCVGVLATRWPDPLHPGGIVVALPVFAAAWALGAAFGLHRRHLRIQLELHDRLRGAEVRRAELELVEQRVRIARELHDVVAHGMSVITVQAGFAGLVADDRDEVRSALHSIETTGRQTLTEMRTLLTVLRDGSDLSEQTLSPAPQLHDLEALIDRTRDAGVDVVCTRSGAITPLPPLIELNAYRIVQEALTNVVKHAGPVTTTVELAYDERWLTITVRDCGPPLPSSSVVPGHGITGMLERARILGGTLEAGPLPGRGYEVVAHLPVPDRSATPELLTADSA